MCQNKNKTCCDKVTAKIKWCSFFACSVFSFCVRQGSVLSPYLFTLSLDTLTTTLCSGVCVILYADDILLIAPSVCDLDALVKPCEFELDKLATVVNTGKACFFTNRTPE